MYIFIKYNYVINHTNDPFGARKTLMDRKMTHLESDILLLFFLKKQIINKLNQD